MAPLGDTKCDQGKFPAQSTATALRKELRRRTGNGAGSATLCSSPEPSALVQILKEQVSSSSRCRVLVPSTDDAGKGGKFPSGITSVAQRSDCTVSKVLVGQTSLPTRCTPAAASTLKVSRMASCPPAVGGGVPAPKKKRTRASKKPRTETLLVDRGSFRETVQSLTGGTYCAQSTATASPIISPSAPPIPRSPSEPSSSTVGPYVVRPQASRPNADGDSGSAGAEVPIVPPTGSAFAAAQELPAFLLECMQSQDEGLNFMMGYTGQSSWSAMESQLITTESVGVSVSSQFSGIYPSEAVKSSTSVYTSASMPFSREESEVSREGNPYQREASTDTGCSKGADLQRHHPEEDYDVDSWINSDKSMYIINQSF